MKRTLLLGAALALAFGAGLATQSMVGAQQTPITSKTVMQEPLVGGIYEEMMMQEVSFQPNAGVPWHIHPDGHEIAYVLEGAIKLQVDKQPDRIVKAAGAMRADGWWCTDVAHTNRSIRRGILHEMLQVKVFGALRISTALARKMLSNLLGCCRQQ